MGVMTVLSRTLITLSFAAVLGATSVATAATKRPSPHHHPYTAMMHGSGFSAYGAARFGGTNPGFATPGFGGPGWCGSGNCGSNYGLPNYGPSGDGG
jgi:hypothetical protein